MIRKKLWKAALGALTAVAMMAQPLSANVVAADGSDTYTPILDRNGDPIDLGGVEIVIRDWWTDPDYNYLTNPADDYEKAKKELAEWCEETYNFTVKIVGDESWGDCPETYLNYVNNYDKDAQKDEYFVFTLYDDERLSAAVAGGKMYDLATLDYIDFEDPIFQGNKVHEQYSIKNHIYAMYTGVSEPRTGVYFNKEVLRNVGIDPDSIYEAQANDTWTWDMFNSLIEQTSNIDYENPLSSSNVYGLVADQGSVATAMVLANGSEFVGLENDEFVNKLDDPKTVEGILYAAELLDYDNGFYPQWVYVDRIMYADPTFQNIQVPDEISERGEGAVEDYKREQWDDSEIGHEVWDNAWDYYRKVFAEGNIAFCIADFYNGQAPYAFDEGWGDLDLGFVMVPKGPSGELVNLWRNNIQVIPGCYDEEKAQKIAFAYYVINQDPKGWEGYNQYVGTAKTGIFDERAITETVPAMCHPNYGTVTYDCMVPNLQIGPQFLWDYNSQLDPYNPDAIGLDNYIAQVSAQWDQYVYDANNGITAGVKGSPNYIRDKNLSWNAVAGKKYWYENGYKQGTVDDPKCISFDGTVRGREVYDPESGNWFWLDADADGAGAVSKEVYVPYVYQDEDEHLNDDAWLSSICELSKYEEPNQTDLSYKVYEAIVNKTGKWIRYTAAGEMIKGWYTVAGEEAEIYPDQAGNTYYYDVQTGLMVKGYATIDGIEYFFDPVSGVLKQ